MSPLFPKCLQSLAYESPFNKQHGKLHFKYSVGIYTLKICHTPPANSTAKEMGISKSSLFHLETLDLFLYHTKAPGSYLGTLHIPNLHACFLHSWEPNLTSVAVIKRPREV